MIEQPQQQTHLEGVGKERSGWAIEQEGQQADRQAVRF
jgi:hypothetical protein